MRISLFKIFNHLSKFGTALTIAGLSTLSFSSQEPPLETVLAQAGQATPSGFRGHSENLNHLRAAPAVTSTRTSVSTPYTERYLSRVKEFLELCPGAQADDPEIPAWFNRRITESSLPTLQRGFVEAAYFTIGRAPETPEKVRALTALNKVLADSPSFLDFLEKKREELRTIIQADPVATTARTKWREYATEDRRQALAHVSRIALRSLLPSNQISFPRVIYLTADDKVKMGLGAYRSRFNEVYVNGVNAEISDSFDFAGQITIHETYHAFVSMLIAWYETDKLVTHAELERQGQIYYLNGIAGGSAVSSEDSYEGYRTSIEERGAWAFQLAAGKNFAPRIAMDMFIDRINQAEAVKISDPPEFRQDSTQGYFPAACHAAIVN